MVEEDYIVVEMQYNKGCRLNHVFTFKACYVNISCTKHCCYDLIYTKSVYNHVMICFWNMISIRLGLI